MRKVIVSNFVSLDGFFAGSNSELDWFVANDEFFESARDLLSNVDTILYGRVTYEGMASYWPTPDAAANDPIMAEKINTATKIVFSRTLDKAAWGDWNNARVVKGNIGEEVAKLKQQEGKNIVIYGSGSIVAELTRAGQIDEYQLVIVPVVLGVGKPLLGEITQRVKLSLVDSKPFKTGVVMSTYALAHG